MRICFVVPAHGRIPLARVTLPRLADVCAELDAAAVVVACDENLAIARRAGLQTIRRDNDALGRRFNDGFARAARHAEYLIPIGNDDLITTTVVRAMLAVAGDPDTVICTRTMSALSPAGELASIRIPYEGGPGIRLFPTVMLHRCAYRPCDETRGRAIDTNIKRNLAAAGPFRFDYVAADPLDILDVKTAGANLNSYEALASYVVQRDRDPWPAIAARHSSPVAEALRLLCP